jgi:hypothetical protein
MDFETCEISGTDQEIETAGITAGYGQADPKPEYFQYKDEGCKYARSCLACPYSKCLYDGRLGKHRAMRQFRTREIKRLYKSGRSVPELMEIFGVSDRTVYRAIKTASRKKRKGAEKNE